MNSPHSPTKEEVMNDEPRVHAYKLLDEFVEAINQDDRQKLRSQFDVPEALAEEIQGVIRDYYLGENPLLGIAPFETAFSAKGSRRPGIELFKMNDDSRWGAECVLWKNEKPSEPILHVEFFGQASSLKLQYKYIGS